MKLEKLRRGMLVDGVSPDGGVTLKNVESDGPRAARGDGDRLRPAARRWSAARPELLHRRGHDCRARLDLRPPRRRRTRSEDDRRPHRACGRRNSPEGATRVASDPRELALQEAT